MNSFSFVVLLLLAAVSVNANFCPGRNFPLTVSTTSGTVTGTYYNGSRAFLGIPFAQPPVGTLRFAPPVAVSKSATTINAVNWPNSCMQASVSSTPGYTQSEDCLYLNVFTPPCKPFSPFQKLPVLVFIHGGRYWTGYAQQFPGDLIAAEQNAIVVSIQYRLNIFGFQAFDGNTNNGLKDQQLALKWVKDNIANFGGDVTSTTIFGESAGGSSVLYHLTIPSSYQYYSKAIMQSVWQWIIPTTATSVVDQTRWARTKGCTGDNAAVLACLRTLNSTYLNPTTGNSNFMLPMVDGTLIKTLPLNSIKTGQYNKAAAMVIGHNYDEGNFMAYSRLNSFQPPTVPVADSRWFSVLNSTLLVYLNATSSNFIISQYEAQRQSLGNWYSAAQFFGDYYITCGSILAAQYLSLQRASFKTYIFNYSSPNYPANEYFTSASHGNELPYVFKQPIYTPYEFSQTDDVMANRMATSWVNFAKYGDSFFSFWLAEYPAATYFGPNAFGFFDTEPYLKNFCSIWQQFYELY